MKYSPVEQIKTNRGSIFLYMILFGLIVFEFFNYSTTDYSLADIMGDLAFVGVRWSTILATAFCLIDFAGLARLFTPNDSSEEPAEVWYLFGAWLLGAVMNAVLTWWGVAVAIANHTGTLSETVVSRHTMTTVVPIMVAVMVFVIRILVIGSLSVAADRKHSGPKPVQSQTQNYQRPTFPPTPPQRPILPPRSSGGGYIQQGFSGNSRHDKDED